MTEKLTDEQLREWFVNGGVDLTYSQRHEFAEEMIALRAERAKLEAALRPFAEYAEQYNEIPGVLLIHDNVELWQDGHDVKLSVGDLRQARAARAGVPFVPTPLPRALAQPAESGATMACPICGVETPHKHTSQEAFDHKHKEVAERIAIAGKPWKCPACNWVNAYFNEKCCLCAGAKP